MNMVSTSTHAKGKEKRSLQTYFDQKVCHLNQCEESQAHAIIEVKQYLEQNLLGREKDSLNFWQNHKK